MEYPTHILPKKHYKNISEILPDNFLIRHFILAKNEELIYDVNGHIENKFLFHPTERFGDLSTSLLGIFNTNDINVDLTPKGKRKYGSYCEGDFTFNIPDHPEDFSIDTSGLRKFWTLKIGNVHNVNSIFSKSNGTETTFTCHVIHTPAKWNFWHFSIRWFLNDDKEYYFKQLENKQISEGNKRRIATAVRVLLKENIQIEFDQEATVPDNCYLAEKVENRFIKMGRLFVEKIRNYLFDSFKIKDYFN